ncbi:TPA: hypothetical protein MIC10_27620 [Klebsiella pneumoniae]|nr:hypothetical protein [Klebsiella pneumoniae]
MHSQSILHGFLYILKIKLIYMKYGMNGYKPMAVKGLDFIPFSIMNQLIFMLILLLNLAGQLK